MNRTARDRAAVVAAAAAASAQQAQPLTLVVPAETVEALARAVLPLLRAQQQHEQQERASQWLDVQDAAAHLRCPVSRLHKLVSRAKGQTPADNPVPFQKEGRRLLFSATELDAWVRRGGAL